MKIVLNKIPEETVEHFYKEKSIGFLNINEHYDLRCQIKENKAKDYSLKFNDKTYAFDDLGFFVENHPDGLFDTSTKLLNRLFDV